MTLNPHGVDTAAIKPGDLVGVEVIGQSSRFVAVCVGGIKATFIDCAAIRAHTPAPHKFTVGDRVKGVGYEGVIFGLCDQYAAVHLATDGTHRYEILNLSSLEPYP